MCENYNVDRDRLFKVLLEENFEQFLEGFFPEIHDMLDFEGFSSQNFLSQEVFSELGNQLHRLDCVVKIPIKQSQESVVFKSACVIVFVEAQHKRSREFNFRMFRYFALLMIKYRQLVVPIVIYSDSVKCRNSQKWDRFEEFIGNKKILDFRFLVVKPSELLARNFLKSNNAVQLALASLMEMESNDLISIKISLLRRLFEIVKEQRKLFHLVDFVDSFLPIEEFNVNGGESDPNMLYLEMENKNMPGPLITYIMDKGRQEGRQEGRFEGETIGLQKGLHQKALDSATKLKYEGVDLEVIARCTGLSLQEVRAL